MLFFRVSAPTFCRCWERPGPHRERDPLHAEHPPWRNAAFRASEFWGVCTYLGDELAGSSREVQYIIFGARLVSFLSDTV